MDPSPKSCGLLPYHSFSKNHHFQISGFFFNQKSNLFLAGDPALGCNSTVEFDCANDGTMCVPLDKLCDGNNDCGAWQDEPKGACHVNECLVKNGGCDHKCVDMPIGHHCECKQGYVLVGDRSCQGKLDSLQVFGCILLFDCEQCLSKFLSKKTSKRPV